MSVIALPVACRVDGRAMDGSPLLPDLIGGALGLMIGPEILLNGGFDTDSVWTKTMGWTILDGTANIAAVAGSRNLSQAGLPLVEGGRYLLTYTVLNYISGDITPAIVGSPIASGAARSANGTYTETLICGASPVQFRFQAGVNSALSLDNASLRQVV